MVELAVSVWWTDPINLGALPFLTHDGQVVTSLSSIIKYISSLEGANKTVDLDAGLTSFEASQKTAWCSHVEAKLGDLAVRQRWPSAADNLN
jgi:sorting and assembly machinery component 37